ncbi:hypothetical protein FJO98_09490 [Enterococcus sp. PF-2]|jgi:hypothetical protein|uniref:Uncharacterized protein n=1 Tax=Enterococcus casseliflavus ATCC 12755 TaxID=888066 RepID=F0EIL1_ENTCA|nr:MULTISPECIES: hypothetical protein [Enterococcus]MBO1095683.1 hypothetical protein [Enterococcus casseliflavus]EGC69911.1 hypothetical protein HMPREF9087_1299 [Enterococcus casseliflavus ATCC 12755]MBO1144016.1 hypothetical protein [Enterococcus casseliflavus]MBV6369652.1 hypothetical protein [Enterococcus casseliflavus]TPE04962.1 hypothetical protein FJP08_06535 [Enterococcus sp. PF-3]
MSKARFQANWYEIKSSSTLVSQLTLSSLPLTCFDAIGEQLAKTPDFVTKLTVLPSTQPDN